MLSRLSSNSVFLEPQHPEVELLSSYHCAWLPVSKIAPSGIVHAYVCVMIVYVSPTGNTYNIPIRFWILDSHPFAPPICFLKPTANMEISVGKHVDAKGRIYLPYLQNWSHVRSDWIFFSECLSLILVV